MRKENISGRFTHYIVIGMNLMNEEIDGFLEHARTIEHHLQTLSSTVRKYFLGKMCRIIHPTWNGQQCGISWPKQHGKSHKICDAMIWNGRIILYINIRGESCPIDLTDVRLL